MIREEFCRAYRSVRCSGQSDLIANAPRDDRPRKKRGTKRPDGGVVTQRTANPCTRVRFPVRPPSRYRKGADPTVRAFFVSAARSAVRPQSRIIGAHPTDQPAANLLTDFQGDTLRFLRGLTTPSAILSMSEFRFDPSPRCFLLRGASRQGRVHRRGGHSPQRLSGRSVPGDAFTPPRNLVRRFRRDLQGGQKSEHDHGLTKRRPFPAVKSRERDRQTRRRSAEAANASLRSPRLGYHGASPRPFQNEICARTTSPAAGLSCPLLMRAPRMD